MAEVFVGHLPGPEGFKKPVVIKRVVAELSHQTKAVEMFLDEARLAARFGHPNVLQVFELFEFAGTYCLAMEHVNGVNFGELIERSLEQSRLLPPRFCLELAAQAAAGLHYAHQLQDEHGAPLRIVHRDVSPSNLAVNWDGGVKVLDFGIASSADSTSTTHPGTLKGKPGYISPEQLLGTGIDGRTDVFGLGVVLFELLTLRRCFPSSDFGAALERARSRQPPSCGALRDDLDPRVDAALHRMLANEPAHRFADANSARAALLELADIFPEAPAAHVLAELYPARETGELRRTHVIGTACETIPSHDRQEPAQTRSKWSAWRALRWSPLALALALATAGIAAWSEERGPESGEAPRPELVDSTSDATAEPVADSPRAVRTDQVSRPRAIPERRRQGQGRSLRARTRAAMVEPGELRLRSDPPMQVLLGTKELGPSPLHIELPPGRHRLTLEEPDLRRRKSVSVVIRSGELTERTVSFGFGRVVVDSKPWANVYLDGIKLGQTPLPPTRLLAGRHRFQLKNPERGLSKSVELNVVAGRTTKHVAQLND